MSKNLSLIRFREHMGGFFHELFHASGMTMTPGNSNERVRAIGERMARTIEAAAEAKSIEVIRRLQVAVSESFKKTEESLNRLEDLAQKHHDIIGNLIEQQKAHADILAELEDRLLELEEEDINTDVDEDDPY